MSTKWIGTFLIGKIKFQNCSFIFPRDLEAKINYSFIWYNKLNLVNCLQRKQRFYHIISYTFSFRLSEKYSSTFFILVTNILTALNTMTISLDFTIMSLINVIEWKFNTLSFLGCNCYRINDCIANLGKLTSFKIIKLIF